MAMILASSVLSMNSAYAASSFDGFYGGIQLNAYQYDIPSSTDPSGDKSNYSFDVNLQPALAFGYGQMISDKVYLGAELMWAPETGKVTNTLTDESGVWGKFSIKAKTTKAIGLNLGYLVTDKLLVLAKFKKGNADLEGSVSYCAVGLTCTSGSGNSDFNDYALGLQYDLGGKIFATAELGKIVDTTSGEVDSSAYHLGAGVGYRF